METMSLMSVELTGADGFGTLQVWYMSTCIGVTRWKLCKYVSTVV